ncbi:MAG: tetratricopeptide repeat protein [Proteobacteria bacterium]|nr:tetratricopeptide repeat protein [Pseudomonadota bacterium]
MESAERKDIHFQNRMKRRSPSTTWSVGDLIRNRYEIYDIKAGGFGIVYIVYDHDDGVPYAIKTLQGGHLANPVAAERFIREAEVWVRLGRHQNIVRAFFVDRIDGQPYIFLECVVGSNLRKTLSGGPVPIRAVLSYAIQFCRGMAHAQKKTPGFAHLDIKPENCLLTQDNILKVTDFSLSKALFEPNPRLGATSPTEVSDPRKRESVMGTFPYMSPEHFLCFGGANIQSDIYSFGVMLYEMLTGKRPLSAESVPQWRDVHLKIKPLEPRATVPSISEGLNDLTMRCLAKNPAERPGNFLVIMDTLETMLREQFHEEIPSSTSEALESWEYSNKGVSLCNVGRFEEAISCFDKALSTDPQNYHAWLNKGVAVGTLGYAEEELECYDKALAITSEYAETWYNKGLALHHLGRFEEALYCYDRALTINPHQAEVWVNKGSALGNLGRFEKELSCYEKALTIKPDHAKAWIDKAFVLIKLGLFEEANACCDKALAISPGLAEAWANKASALGVLKRFDETIRCTEEALAINPYLCEAWVSKGLALWNLGRFEEAISCYEKTLTIDPRHAGAWFNKGLALRNLGLKLEANRCFQKAIALDSTLSQ